MKKSILRAMAMALAMVLILAMFASCGQQGEQGPAGPQGEQGEKGDDGNGISSIIKTSNEGLVDTYTITFTDGKTTTFTVTNGTDGEQGIQGIQGVKGEDGHTPVITIQNGYWYIDGVNTNQSAAGVSGATGNGISNIAKTSTEGLVDTYTITYTNGTTTTFTVTNGAQGIQGIQGVPGKDGHSPVITIQDGYWYIDGVNTNEAVGEGVKGDTGNGISSIAKTNTEGLVDTYTITFTDGTTTTFTVTNGANGNDGKDGINGTNGKDGVDGEDGKDGQDGTDGETPYIKDGYWWIGKTNTNVKAEGSDGKDGQNGADGKDGVDGEDGKDGQDGADGQTPYIKDGYWWIGETNTNVKAEGTDGKDGQNGADGKDGVDGEDGKDGQDGQDGADGVSVVNAYVDENLHLWIVLSNGTKIDAGYVGVTVTPTPTTYTVTFVDYNGTELKVETVERGNSATAPADPTRDGFTFVGWDKVFDNITGDLTVTAQYESASPQISVSQVTAKAGDTNVTIAITVKNNPGVIGASFKVTYDPALSLKNAAKGDAWSSLSFTKSGVLTSPCSFGWDGLEAEDTSNGVVLILTFDVSASAAVDTYNISISYNNGDIFDDEFNSVMFEIVQGSIVVE